MTQKSQFRDIAMYSLYQCLQVYLKAIDLQGVSGPNSTSGPEVATWPKSSSRTSPRLRKLQWVDKIFK